MDTWKRLGIYYAPPAGSSLATFGATWLGWDAEAGRALRPDPMPTLPRDWDEITRTPRRYGFHATLKPPFRLVDWRSADQLDLAIAEFARGQATVEVAPLVAVVEHGFLSLRPGAPCPALDALAAACVEGLDDFRAPPDETELARRRKVGLSPRQDAHLTRWGYPYVMEDFAFHLTLTGHVGDTVAAEVAAALAPQLAPHLADALAVREVCLFGEPDHGPFRLLKRYPLAR